METAPHKLYIDARAKREGTNSSFTWSPGRPFFVDRCKAFIDSVHIPNVFQTIDLTNRFMYVTEDGPVVTNYRRVELSTGQYSLDELLIEMQAQLNANTVLGANSYLVTEDDGYITVANFTFGASYAIWTEHFLDEQGFQGFAAPWNSCEQVTGMVGDTFYTDGITALQHVNLQRHQTLFITSSLGSHSDSVGPVGQTTIARKIVLDGPYGTMVNDFHSSGLDYVFCEKQSISSIKFSLVDWKGHEVEMKLPWSLSIIFFPLDEVL